MSDFAISSDQRQRLLAGKLTPLTFKTKPSGCEVGARYVLAWQRPRAQAFEDGFVVRIPRCPVWFLTVKSVVRVARNQDVNWLVRFDVTDLRDRDVFLRPGGGDLQGRDPLGAGSKPDREWLEAHTKMIASYWTRRRVEQNAEEMRLRGRERSRARRKRAA